MNIARVSSGVAADLVASSLGIRAKFRTVDSKMHASKQSRNMKEYYDQNPTTGEQMGEGVAVPGSD